MSQEPVVQLLDVSKVFHDLWGRPRVPAVEALSLEVAPGEVLGLLGPNGAGKSTTIKLLLGLLYPTRGKLAVFGREPRDLEVRRRTGYLPEETRLHKFLTAAETLDFFGQLIGLDRVERRRRTGALLEMVGLADARDRTVGEMSKGMARRIGLGVALVGDPTLVVLDEPTSGLDPIGTREVKDLVIELARRGKTILLSSHLLSDVEDACHRIAILYGGKLRALGKTDELLRDERIRIELDRPSPEHVRALEAAARAAAGEKPVTIGSPRDRLEAFFLRVVGAARAENLATGGAREGAGVAGFLGGQGVATSRSTSPTPQPPSQNPQLGSQNPQLVGQNPQLVSQNPQLVSQNPQLVRQNPQLVGQNPQLVGQNPQLVSQTAHAMSQLEQPVSQLAQPVSKLAQPVSKLAQPVSQLAHAVGKEVQRVNEEVHPVSQLAQPVSKLAQPVSQLAHAVGKDPHAAGQEAQPTVEPTPPPRAPSSGGVALERVEREPTKPQAPATPVENPKTRAVLDRLLQPKEPRP